MLNFINSVKIDKLRHLAVGIFLLFLELILYAALKKYFDFTLIFGLVTTLIAALKELFYDKLLKRGNCEIKDFLYTVIPVFLLYLSFFITKYYPVL